MGGRKWKQLRDAGLERSAKSDMRNCEVASDWKFNELEQREKNFNDERRGLTNGMLAIALSPG